MELMDAYDRDFNKVSNVTLVRGEMIPDGMFQLYCCVVVRHIDGTYLLTRRGNKPICGGMWEASAGGATKQGEAPEEAALRELEEETGIVSGQLHLLGKVFNESLRTVFAEYLFTTDVSKDSLRLQKEEVVDYRWVTPAELMAVPQEKLVTPKDILKQFIPELCI